MPSEVMQPVSCAPETNALPQTKLLINNEWCSSVSGETFATVNPATGEEICRVASAQAEDVERAVQAARAALARGTWRKLNASERGRLLYQLADLIEENAEQLAMLETLDNGKPYHIAKNLDVTKTAACYRYFAGWCDKIHGKTIPIDGSFLCYTRLEPIGVIGQIIPWNYPMLMQAWKLAPALAAGNTVVMKPSELTPLSALRIGELIVEAGFPEGVVNLLPGYGSTAGTAIARHPDIDKVAFTGSTATGRAIQEAAAGSNLKRVSLELGGKSPNIIFADADLDAAVQGAYAGAFSNQGQVCCAGTRVFVERSIYDKFLEKIVARARERVVGDPFDTKTEQGPQIGEAQLHRILGYVEYASVEGATLAYGGRRLARQGYFMEPTIFCDVRNEMRIAQEEIFGPVMCVLPFTDMDAVIEQANDTQFGLAAGAWTRDVARAHSVAAAIRAGTVWINCYNVLVPSAPFGGFKQSGNTRELGEDGLLHYSEVKTVTLKL